jgi:hypothetical protein
MDEILSLYKKYNWPGAQKLFLLAKSEGKQQYWKMFKNLYQVGQKNNNLEVVNTLNKVMGILWVTIHLTDYN